MVIMIFDFSTFPAIDRFEDFPKKDLIAYKEWFIAAIPHRAAELEKAMVMSAQYRDWQADFTPASLGPLGDWFAGRVKTRDRTEAELRAIETSLAFPVDVSREDLADETKLIARDVGMYLGAVLLKSHPTLRWDQKSGSKRFVDYGHPIIVGFGKATLNPVRVATVIAYGVADETKSGTNLGKAYRVWSELVAQ